MYDLVVVGAGPSGCRIAELVSRRGYKTLLLDKKTEIGKPVQCAGLVSYRLNRIVTDLPNNIIVNKVNRAKFVYGSKDFEIESKKPFFVIDREQFDKFMFLKARKSGVETRTQTEFKNLGIVMDSIIEKGQKGNMIKEDSLFIDTTDGKIQTRLLVGADGPISTVASKSKLVRPSNILTGIQTEINGDFDPDMVELHFNPVITPDFFGWVIPLSSKKARVGLACKKDASNRLKNFVNNVTGGSINKTDVKPDVVGRINYGFMRRTSSERVMVVGDAACQVKPFSGGGVIYGLIGAGYCSNACIKSLSSKKFSTEYLFDEYDKKWKSHLGGSIKKGMFMRKMLSGSGAKMNLMLSLADQFKFIIERLDVDLL